MPKVTLSHLSKIYSGDKESPAVEDLNLDIADGEFVVLLGPADCGKSTTLRMIAGLEDISRGDVFIDDRRVTDVPPKDRDIAMIFPNYALYPHMSVYQNMAFALKLRKFSKPEVRKRVSDAADILGIGDLLDRKPRALSGLERQRVALGRAIVRQPKLLLFDEPLSNLGARARLEMRTEIARLHQRLQTTTTIYATRDQIEAMTMADRIVAMNDGRAQQNGTPWKLYHEPENLFVAGFLGCPPMNFIQGELRQGRDGIIFKEIDDGTLQVTLDEWSDLQQFAGKRLLLGIRPEEIEIAQSAKPAGAVPSFPAIVDVVEPMGAGTILHLQTGAHTIVCRSQQALDHREAGRRLQFELKMSKVHLFDPETTQRIV